jgi:hypothetical protein
MVSVASARAGVYEHSAPKHSASFEQFQPSVALSRPPLNSGIKDAHAQRGRILDAASPDSPFTTLS